MRNGHRDITRKGRKEGEESGHLPLDDGGGKKGRRREREREMGSERSCLATFQRSDTKGEKEERKKEEL